MSSRAHAGQEAQETTATRNSATQSQTFGYDLIALQPHALVAQAAAGMWSDRAASGARRVGCASHGLGQGRPVAVRCALGDRLLFAMWQTT